MSSNYVNYFYGNEYEDPYKVTAYTLFEFLMKPGIMMLEIGIDDEDLEIETSAIKKIENWLRDESR